MKVLVLGGYGFIGADVIRACASAGFECVGLGRSVATGRRLLPGVDWIGADMARLVDAEEWRTLLHGVDAVVNAAGALQDGARDHLETIHHRAIVALVAAAEKAGVKRFIQISAPGADAGASTAFMRTKAMGDAAVRASSLDWVVFKPGLVIGRGAYGGTALLRMLAGSPMMTPLVHASARVQTVALDDVAAAVVMALKGEVPVRCDYDLAEEEPHTLREIVRSLRAQIGFAPARIEPDLPAWVAAPVSALADAAGWFGWRSPLRSTAMKVMGENVIADPAPWRAATGRALKSLDQTLAGLPGSAQERLFARAQLALPLMLVALAGFWIASGAIGLARINEAAALLPDIGRRTAERMVVAGGLVDIAIGVGLLLRPTSRAAAALSVVIAAVYLVMGGILAPHLWADPLGPYVKIIPAMTLGLALAIMLEER